MAQTGFTPISTYYTTTASAVPTAGNLVNGELALNINTADGKLFFKDSAGVVQVLATKASASGSFTNLAYTGTLTGGTGVVNLGSGQFYKDASGNIGVGTASPAQKLEVNGGAAAGFMRFASTLNATGFDMGVGGSADPTAYIYNRNNTPLLFATNNAERMRIDSSGNVLIGTATAVSPLTVYQGASNNTATNAISIMRFGATYGSSIFHNYNTAVDGGQESLNLSVSDGAGTPANNSLTKYRMGANGVHIWYGSTTSTERMRIDSSGNLLVGTTTSFPGSGNTTVGFMYENAGTLFVSRSGSDVASFNRNQSGGLVSLRVSGSEVGSISYNGTATLYNATSDYRLKTVIAPVADASLRLDALQPIEYDWKSGGRTRGFLAHQFAEVYPNSVTGEKDAVDADGKPVYQTMQASSAEVMADLIAEIQSLRKRVAQLESK